MSLFDSRSPRARAERRHLRALENIKANYQVPARLKRQEKIKRIAKDIYYEDGKAFRLVNLAWVPVPEFDSKRWTR